MPCVSCWFNLNSIKRSLIETQSIASLQALIFCYLQMIISYVFIKIIFVIIQLNFCTNISLVLLKTQFRIKKP
ncbi:MAG: hypothetical protein LBB88_02875 [Planctomycetaceae bacterium]|nr:hypothetical protein [Planctomycetaceae bacterium]